MNPIPVGVRATERTTDGPDTLDAQQTARWLHLLEQDRSRFLLCHPFTATLTLHLGIELVTDPRIPTAATDGRRLYFNPDFLSTLDAEQRLFVMAHEVWHCVAGHLSRQHGRDARRWNLAIDHEVNWLLVQDGFTLPPGAILYRRMRGSSAEQVYAWLKDQPVTDSDWSFDLHELPDGFGEPVDRALLTEWQRRLWDAAEWHRQRGTLPDGLALLIRPPQVEPQLPWCSALRDFVLGRQSRRRGWDRPARRHWHRGLWLPDMRPNGLRLMLAVDTSGSTRLLLPMFMAELLSLMKSEQSLELTLVECDARIQRVRTFHSGDDLRALERLQLRGGGKTDLRPPFRLAEEDPPDALIFLTDGCGPAPRDCPSFEVMWVLPCRVEAPTEWGECLRLEWGSAQPGRG